MTITKLDAETKEPVPGVVFQYATEYGIPEYVELIKAVMMQESGGRGADPMQASESGYNTRYPNTPGGITDPEYSVECGVQVIRDVLERAGVESPLDMEHIKLALQGYNYGPGYIAWAVSNYGGYSLSNAEMFSAMMAERMGWSRYGDTQYVPHVLRYYILDESLSEQEMIPSSRSPSLRRETMDFALERRKVEKQIEQVPVIRYR